MIILRNSEELKIWIKSNKNSGKTIGFVPTMGALHEGHISLVRKSNSENDVTIVSVFVNPTQFNNPDDLKKYPRTEEADTRLLEQAGVDVVFIPTVETIYPEGEMSKKFDFKGIENQMEGKFRPGHFDGVATVVGKFFEMVQPDRAYFGEKDFQQLRIIQELVNQNDLPLQIVPVPIMREPNGLAMSSRNTRLSPEMRKESPKIYQILQEAHEFLKSHSIQETKEFVTNAFSKTKLKLEYFEVADESTLESVLDYTETKKIRGFIAVFADDIRLIDNISLN